MSGCRSVLWAHQVREFLQLQRIRRYSVSHSIYFELVVRILHHKYVLVLFHVLQLPSS